MKDEMNNTGIIATDYSYVRRRMWGRHVVVVFIVALKAMLIPPLLVLNLPLTLGRARSASLTRLQDAQTSA
jgi:hypothetical protein